jgi:hypothetical protein
MSKARYVQSFGEDFVIFVIIFVSIFSAAFASIFPAILIFAAAAFPAAPASAFTFIE